VFFFMVMLSSYTYLIFFFSSRTKHPTDQKIILKRVTFRSKPRHSVLSIVHISQYYCDREGNMMCMSDAVSVNIVHNFPISINYWPQIRYILIFESCVLSVDDNLFHFIFLQRLLMKSNSVPFPLTYIFGKLCTIFTDTASDMHIMFPSLSQ
jgi:hypothetical protein